jgi:hypothetical protein
LAQRLGLKGAGAIAARLRFARQYGLEAVAVGAEDEAMMKGLEYVGFTAAQGIWVQKPMPLDDLMAWDGTWARGNGAMDVIPVAVQPEGKAPVARAPAPASAAVAHAATVNPQPAAPVEEKVVSKEDMQRALEAVRARRHPAPASAEAKPAARKVPVKATMPAVDLSDLEDVLEDEEASAPPPPPAFGQQKGGGVAAAADPCPPMKTLVERRKAVGGGQAAPAPRRASAQDGVA